MSTISKPVMVHQEPNFIYRPAVKSEVLVSPLGPLQVVSRGADQGYLSWALLSLEWRASEVGQNCISQMSSLNLLIGQEMRPHGCKWMLT